jgi:hypothetical protein
MSGAQTSARSGVFRAFIRPVTGDRARIDAKAAEANDNKNMTARCERALSIAIQRLADRDSARRQAFCFLLFQSESRSADFGCAWVAPASRTRQRKMAETVLYLPNLRFSHPNHSGLPEAPLGVEEDRNHTRRLYCLPPGIATCYPRSATSSVVTGMSRQ